MSIINESFNNFKIQIIEEANDLWIPAINVAQALGYSSPSVAVQNIINRNPADFEGKTCITKLVMQTQTRGVRLLNEEGVYSFCMLAKTPDASRFRNWVCSTLKLYRKTEGPILVSKEPLAVLEQINRQVALSLQIMRDQSYQLHEQNQRLDYQDLKIDKLERLARSTYIDDTQAWEIQRRVAQLAYTIAENDGLVKPNPIIFSGIWTKFHEIFEITKYRQLPKLRYYDAIGILDEHIRNEGAIPPKEC